MSDKILIVDDSAWMRQIIQKLILSSGWHPHTLFAENGLKALELLDEHPDIALITLDIEMPEMDGLEFLGVLNRSRTTRAKIVVVSSSPEARTALKLGANAVIEKPSGPVSFDLAEKKGDNLLSTIKRLMFMETLTAS